MIELRSSTDRGHANYEWLDTFHSFSFADYHDPQHMGFSVLRVINEDVIQGGAGFPMHGHRDMEIITYVVEGALEHKDSMGNTSVIRPGEVQYMCAGTGVTHSEFNHLKDQPTKLLQIWILPDRGGYEPSYDQKNFASSFGCSDMVLVASGSGKNNSIKTHQDIDMYVAKVAGDAEMKHLIQVNRKAWLQIIKGEVEMNGVTGRAGDGLSAREQTNLKIKAKKGAEFILFNLP